MGALSQALSLRRMNPAIDRAEQFPYTPAINRTADKGEEQDEYASQKRTEKPGLALKAGCVERSGMDLGAAI